MKRLAAFLLLCVLAVPAAAQDASKETKDPTPQHAARFQVVFNSGRKITGIVRGTSLWTREVGGAWESCDEQDEGAGIKLWFIKQQYGYVWIKREEVKEIVEVTVPGEDPEAELSDLRDKAREKAAEERRRIREEKAAAAAEKAAAAEAAGAEGEKPADGDAQQGESAADQIADYTALLVKYPPGRWTLETPDKIRQRFVTNGQGATDEEKAFLEIFERWKKAYETWKKSKTETEAPTDTTADGTGSGS